MLVPSARTLALSVIWAAASLATPAVAAKGPPGPKPLEPIHSLKPAEGYFDEAFAMDAGGAHLWSVRTDGATFAKLELTDLETGKTTSSFDLPAGQPPIERLEPVPGGKGVILIAREGKPDAPVHTAQLIDASGRAVAKVGPAQSFGRPGDAQPELLVAFNRKAGPREGDFIYTITPYRLDSLAPVGKPRVYKTVDGTLKNPAFRVLDFSDGYSKAIGELPRAYSKKNDVRQPARMATLDTLTGKIVGEAEIGDLMAWADSSRLRVRHPGRTTFAELNKDDSGVDVVGSMGSRRSVELVAPFGLYDAKSLTDQEGPEPGAFFFGIAIDPLNPDAVKRAKPDLPMLDIYSASNQKDATKGEAKTEAKVRGRIFVPRPVTWRAGYGKLVVLKRFKSFTRGGDELDVYRLH